MRGDFFKDVPREDSHYLDYNASVKSILACIVCFAAGVVCMVAFRGPISMKVSADGQPDPATLERFLRRYYAWPADLVSLKVSPFKPAAMPGMLSATVQAIPKAGKGEVETIDFQISADGRFLLEKAPIRVEPDPYREIRDQIDLRDQPAFGSAVPRVTIVEYGDLQCSFCKSAVTVIRQDIPRDFSREVRIVFKNYPLWEMHPWAWDAAAAGSCIYKQKADAFWPYHDWAYEQQGRFSPEQFKKAASAFAQTQGVDLAKYNTCLTDPDTRAAIERSLQEGKAVGVTGTPSFYINGHHIEGSQPYSEMKRYITSELEYLNANGK
jgi:protein-disulfide isomerase